MLPGTHGGACRLAVGGGAGYAKPAAKATLHGIRREARTMVVCCSGLYNCENTSAVGRSHLKNNGRGQNKRKGW